jgi:hypothetical protein
MSWTDSRPRSTWTLEILTTYCDSCLASATRSPSILSTHTRALSRSIDRSYPLVGCRSRSNSSASIAYRQRRSWRSSSIWPRSVNCRIGNMRRTPG